MRLRFIAILMVVIVPAIYAQKKTIPLEPFNKWWYHYNNVKISENGRFVTYGDTIVTLKDFNNNKWISFPKGSKPTFDKSSSFLILQMPDRKLNLVDLKNFKIREIQGVNSYNYPEGGVDQWIYLSVSDTSASPLLLNLFTGKKLTLQKNAEHQFSKRGDKILSIIKDEGVQSIYNQDLRTLKKKFVFMAKEILNTNLKGANSNIAVAYRNDGKVGIQIINLLSGVSKTIPISKFPIGSKIDESQLIFNKSGSQIFFNLKMDPLVKTSEKTPPKLWIWGPTDQSNPHYLEGSNAESNHTELYSYDLPSGQLHRICNEFEKPTVDLEKIKDHIIVKSESNGSEEFWRGDAGVKLVDTRTGETIKINDEHRSLSSRLNEQCISPDEKHIIVYNSKTHSYQSLNTETGKWKDLTAALEVKFDFTDVSVVKTIAKSPPGIAGFSTNSKWVFVYDLYDIWKLDVNGMEKPICITKSTGRSSGTVFRFNDEPENIERYAANGKAFINSFNIQTKENGFYEVNLEAKIEPVKLYTGNYLFFAMNHLSALHSGEFSGTGYRPIRAKSFSRFLVTRMSEKDFPNLFATTDFKDFDQLTFDEPQKQYNWLTSEQFEWNEKGGQKGLGILYKPEDFNPAKKYPLIVYFYERLSNELHYFHKPEYSEGPINIPYFVSSGYIVLSVDINFSDGHPAESFYNSVDAATTAISKKSFIDTNAIAIQGHSYAGYGVNNIISRSQRKFAAASSAAGITNVLTNYGSLTTEKYSNNMSYWETYQGRINAPLYEQPSLYVENSPIFHSKQIETPLLLQCADEDFLVHYNQSVEMYYLLRRQKKPVWLLEYKFGGHTLADDNAKDYTIRLKQFFDHYLKGADAPAWMSKPQAGSTASDSSK